MKKSNLNADFLDNLLEDKVEGGETQAVRGASPDTFLYSDVFNSDVFKSTAFGRNTSSIYTLEPGHLCPHCHYGHVEEDISFSGTPCEFFVYCPVCNAHICP